MKRSAAVFALLLIAQSASAACINRFIPRKDSAGRWIITLLTGRLTFQEAVLLAKDINDHHAPPIEWVDGRGKTISKQMGDLKVVRPMPVSCEGKTSGVVLIATFLAPRPPQDRISIKFDQNTTVEFDQQKE